LKQLTAGAFFGFDLAALEKDASGVLAETIWKTIRFLFRIDAAAKNDRLSAAGKKLSERVLAAPRIFLLGVVPSMPAVFRVPSFRKMVESGVSSNLTPEEVSWWAAYHHRFAGWHLMDWAELASYAAVAPKEDALFDQLATYTTELTTGGLVRPTGLFPSFRDWYLLQHLEQVPAPLEQHRRAWDNLTHHVSDLFGFPHKP
jgi:hypothetical protein